MILLSTVCVLLYLHTVFAADILVTVAPQGKSHGRSYVPLLDEIAKKGHNVTIYMETYKEEISFGEQFKYWYINVTDQQILLEKTNNSDHNIYDFWLKNADFFQLKYAFSRGSKTCTIVMKEHLEEFRRIINYPWDLILIDSLFTTCGYGIATASKAHHVILHSSSVEEPHAFCKGYGRHQLTLPPLLLDYRVANFDPSNFWDRLRTAYDWAGSIIMINIFASSEMEKVLKTVVESFSFSELNKQSTLSFTDMPEELYLPAAKNYELFVYGAYCATSHSLPRDLLNFISDSASRGTILISFGTFLDWNEAPPEVLEAFFNAVNNLTDYRIIWSYKGPILDHGKHLKLMNWVPQSEILNDQRTKLFISHGGMKSLKEATCAAMPTLFMPIFGDQVRNAFLAKYHGFGEMINKRIVTADLLLQLITKLINNSLYKKNAVKLRERYGDSLIPAVEEGAHWINRLLKYGGRFPEYFYTRSTNTNLIKHFNLDLVVIIPALVVMVLIAK